jgi:glutathione peroxidase
MGQEPGTDAEIKTFCSSKYNVNFPLFDKIEVNGDHAHPLYKFLETAELEEGGGVKIGWNFTKFLIDRKGHPLKRFVTTMEPEETETAIQEEIKKR